MPDHQIQYSEEAQDILGKIPGWIIRWGVTVLFVIFLGIVAGCYFISYPQTVDAPIVITTLNPPADLLARSSGRISQIFVTDGTEIDKDQTIALLYNTADYLSVNAIERNLTAPGETNTAEAACAPWLDNDYQLGELQSVYLDYRRACLNYRNYLQLDYKNQKQGLLKQQIRKNQEYFQKQTLQRQSLAQDLLYERKSLERDSLLFQNQVVSSADYEKSWRSYLQKQAAKESFEASLTQTELSILQMEQQLVELSIQQSEEVMEYEQQVNHAKQQLLAQIEQWRYNYVITSPIAGKLVLTTYWSENQSVLQGERIATVVPNETSRVIGRAIVPFSGIGKVELGQRVNIKLNAYPYMEYGQLRGTITNLSDVPESDGYMAEVSLPQGLSSTYRREFNLIQQMDGTAEIVTQDVSLLERLFQPIRAIFDN